MVALDHKKSAPGTPLVAPMPCRPPNAASQRKKTSKGTDPTQLGLTAPRTFERIAPESETSQPKLAAAAGGLSPGGTRCAPEPKENVVSNAPAGLAVRTQKRYGWRPDTPDLRDFMLAVAPAKTLPPNVSLRAQMPPAYDQGQLGSCTANSIGGLLELNERQQEETEA